MSGLIGTSKSAHPPIWRTSEGPKDQEASNEGEGTDDTLQVTRILETNDITCCLVGDSAVVFYGGLNSRHDWEICVPTHLVTKARDVLLSKPDGIEYCLTEPWPYRQTSIAHTYNRFKIKDVDYYLVIVPSNDAHMDCIPSNITRSLRGLPYPTLRTFVQSSLEMRNMLQLEDVVDGALLSEDWGEENLCLEGTNDVEWADELNKRGKEFDGGKYAHWAYFVPNVALSKRKMWESTVRDKEKRLQTMEWGGPRDIFVTQHRLIGEPDPWTVLSESY